MKQLITLSLILFFSAAQSQSIVSVVPSSGNAGQTLYVTITGDDNTDFYATSPTNTVSFMDQFSNILPISDVFYPYGNEIYLQIALPTNVTPGDYTLTVTNSGGTFNFTFPIALRISNTLAVNQYFLKGIRIAPNPASEFLEISLPQEIAGSSRCSIFDIKGKRVYDYKLKSSNTNIDIRGLQSGTYILKIVNPQGTISKKFIKK
jgi:hypothetical protein